MECTPAEAATPTPAPATLEDGNRHARRRPLFTPPSSEASSSQSDGSASPRTSPKRLFHDEDAMDESDAWGGGSFDPEPYPAALDPEE
ncbi:hypothetical protein H632_c2169p0 [Helicosporidium sp. ATCC 50920]|nr:hypothetical protein H632_c2169p0 [Helicosporidium sp. ATCC 50920]|eukprot:KDD73447.1 hypothetical protein H632_c2169p0 [Helicosporidium sp. ATCC 50920]